MTVKRHVGLAVIAALLLLTARALPARASNGLDEYYRGVRTMGMGGAGTAVPDDADAVFYNPASLSNVTGFHLVLLNPKVDVSADTITSLSTVKSASSKLDGPTLSSLFGQNIGGDASVMPMILFPGFALGYYDDYQGSFVARNTALPSMEMEYFHDRGLVGGLSHEFKVAPRQYLRVGVSGKFLTRNGFDQTLSLDEILALDKSYFESQANNSASGFGATAGVQYQLGLSRSSDLILSSAWQDIGDTSFGPSDMANRPPSIPQNVSAGGAYVQRFSSSARATDNFKIVFEGRHLELGGVDPILKLHLGAEVQIGDIGLQAGVNQDSLCAGVSLDLGFLEVAAVTYGVEDESEAFMDRDRHYMLQATFRIDLFGKTAKTSRDTDRIKYPRQY